MMNKRGQFYLVAAMIIISIMVSFITYQNHLRTSPVSYKIYDLGKELDLETAQVIDYGIFTKSSEISSIMESWANNFSEYSGEKAEQEKFVFIYCKANQICEGFESTSSSADSCISNACVSTTLIELTEINLDDCPKTNNIITCTISGVNYKFSKDEGFYFVIKGTGGEVAQK